MSDEPKGGTPDAPRPKLDAPSYKAGVADGRVQAIEESLESLAALIVKAESMVAAFGPEVAQSQRENAEHTVRALHVAFAAVADCPRGGAAFRAQLAQSKERLQWRGSTTH